MCECKVNNAVKKGVRQPMKTMNKKDNVQHKQLKKFVYKEKSFIIKNKNTQYKNVM